MDLNIFEVIVTALTGFLTFLLGQRRGKKEVESIHLQNLEKSIQIYQTIINDLKKEIEKLNTKVESLETMVDELMLENQKLQKLLRDKQS